MVGENGRLKCGQCGDTSTEWSKMLESTCEMDSMCIAPIANGPLAHYIEGMKIVRKVISNAPLPCGYQGCLSTGMPVSSCNCILYRLLCISL